ncbi:MarR family transcriptional regulator [Terasakiella sp. A23]|uniref:MarR family winged helix-turn-helix transcriptional regulator n=1 Tax=Terasakiella sp. FCG-A23 TaxID=3080561 RepID=UPI0029537EBF|nr:MarR family transcriptional regulator [Terasakiella sp. A23]MDV7339538.1 MarR family transcriptional regulator [Terasakiella sp. A23]
MLLRDDDEDDVQRDLILDQYLPYRMAVIAHMMSEGFAKRYSQEYNMSIGEWRVMANLGHQEPQSAHEIGSHSHLDKVQVSRAVSRLEKKEWIAREGDTVDRRRSLLTLTPKGREVFNTLGKLALDFEDDVSASLSTEEYAALDKILHKLSKRAASLS